MSAQLGEEESGIKSTEKGWKLRSEATRCGRLTGRKVRPLPLLTQCPSPGCRFGHPGAMLRTGPSTTLILPRSMRFPTASFLGAAACILLISAPGHAQPSADARRYPRAADLADLSFEPSSPAPAASPARPIGLHKNYSLEAAGFSPLKASFQPTPTAVTEWPSRFRPAGRAAGCIAPPAPALPRKCGPPAHFEPARRFPARPAAR